MIGNMKRIALFFICSLFLFSCQREKTGKLVINFTASVDGEDLVFNDIRYKNAVGNQYSVEELKYFISDIILVTTEGYYVYLTSKNIHYVDHSISSTLRWEIGDLLTATEYKYLYFVFGLSAENNVSNRFLNPPESNMAWPSTLGGGYHYMQINGKWDDNGIVSPLNIHTGICKTISADSLITYSHNSFGVLFSEADFSISENKTTELTLDMNINQWFTNPVQYDFRVHGPGIMEDELAQLILQANGWNVFSLSK